MIDLQSEIFKEFFYKSTITSIVLIYFFYTLAFLGIGLFTTNNYKKLLLILSVSFLLTGILILVLISNPGLVIWLYDFIK